ncbi:MAG: hypothetical protein R6U41_09330 [Desulfosalsimonas sp.]|uniref:hypothetical protein n=1 Tax=Desulfosalsimonas sp. TaxID=3073848 RepID=UPI0039709C90
MNDKTLPGIEELRRRRKQSLEKTEKAVAARPEQYRQIKRLVEDVLARPVEISEYYRIARDLSRLLEQLNASAPGSLFAYYHENIAPERKGDVRYFKMMCTDLRNQIHQLDQFRRSRHNLRIVQ